MGDRSPFGRPRINRANHAPPRDGAGLKFASTELVSIDAVTARRSPGWESLTEMGAGNAVQNASLGEEVVRRVNELAAISEDGDKLTASFSRRSSAQVIAAEGFSTFELPRGAGHDGMAMIDVADVGMIFTQRQKPASSRVERRISCT